MMKMRGRKPKGPRKEVICSRCGQPGYEKINMRGSRQYIYVYHYQEKKLKMCYVGPVNGYVYCKAPAMPQPAPAPSPSA